MIATAKYTIITMSRKAEEQSLK